nr:hypothetical protein BgiMline_018438 [Biomphalaria glabrata]
MSVALIADCHHRLVKICQRYLPDHLPAPFIPYTAAAMTGPGPPLKASSKERQDTKATVHVGGRTQGWHDTWAAGHKGDCTVLQYCETSPAYGA